MDFRGISSQFFFVIGTIFIVHCTAITLYDLTRTIRSSRKYAHLKRIKIRYKTESEARFFSFETVPLRVCVGFFFDKLRLS